MSSCTDKGLLVVMIQRRRHALQLESVAGAARPGSILNCSVAFDFPFSTAIARAHDFEALVTVVLIDEDILLGVASRCWRYYCGGIHLIRNQRLVGLSDDQKLGHSMRQEGRYLEHLEVLVFDGQGQVCN